MSADLLYGAAVLAVAAFKSDEWTDHIGPATRLQVEARGPSVTM